ncbi:MAG: outer membrane beta-barrel protein, partial [Parvibaculales bacterium]
QRAYIGRWYASCAYDFDGDGTLDTAPPKGEGGTVIPTTEDCVDADDFHFRPNELTLSQTLSEGDNNSLSVSAQWEPVKKLRFSLEAGLRESIRRIHRSSLGLGGAVSAENSSNIESLILNDSHSAIYALYTDRNFSSQSFSLERKGEYKNIALTAQWRDEDWEIDGELSTSLADTQYPNQRLEFRSAKADHEQEISVTKEGISGKFLPSGSVSEPSAWKFHNYDSSRGGYVSDRVSAKFDAKKYVGQGQGFTSWKLGGRIDRKKVKRNAERWRFSDGGDFSFRNNSLTQIISQNPELANGFLRLSESGVSDSFSSIEMPSSWLAPNRHSFASWESALNIGDFIPNPSQEYEQKETVSALYFLGEFAKNRMRGNMGLRYVDTAQEFYWNQTVRNSAGEGTNTTIPLHTSNDSQNWLPSLYMSFGMGRGKFFRFGLARAISRPSTGQLRPAYRINYYNKTGRRGNPNLTPARAVQYDFGYEYQYGRRAGQLSFGVFYHDIRNFIYYTRAVESLVLDLGGAAEEVEISKPEKGVGGWTRGLEAGWRQSFRNLPAPWKYISMKMDVSVSKHFRPLYNAELLRTDLSHISLRRKQSLTLYYDQAPFSARLSYARNARRFRNATSQSGRPEYDAPRNSLDFFMQYRVNEDSRISFTAKNLTDEKYIRYNGEPAAILRESHNGRSFEISWQTSF